MSRTVTHETVTAADRVVAGRVQQPAVTSLALVLAATVVQVVLKYGSQLGLSAEWRARDCDGGDWCALGALSAARTCEEQNMRRGLYRILGTDGRPNDVRVDDGGISVPVEEELYCARGYRPPVNELPWEEDYLRQHAPAKP